MEDFKEGSRDNYSKSWFIPKSRFVESPQKKNGRFRRSYGSGGGVYRLWEELQYPFEPYHYSLKANHLGMPEELAQSHLINYRDALKLWKDRIRELFEPPYFFKFEVGKPNAEGKLGMLHLHLIADVDAGLLELPRTGQLVKPIGDFEDFERRMIYLYKLAVPDCEQAREEFVQARLQQSLDNQTLPKSKQFKRLPQVSGFVWE